jgi:hypothetical protein
VEVEAGGRLVKPWVRWFVDVGTNAVCGAAVTPDAPSRESIVAVLRAAITMEAPYGSPGGLPEQARTAPGARHWLAGPSALMAGGRGARRNWIAVKRAVVAPAAVAAILVPVRASFHPVDAALVLTVVVVAIAASGFRIASLVARCRLRSGLNSSCPCGAR